MANTAIHPIDPELFERLREQAARRGVQVNELVEDLLSTSLDAPRHGAHFAGRIRPAGSWTLDDECEFIAQTQRTSEVDREQRV